MIRYEDQSVEQAALSGKAYIAIPFEIYESTTGEVFLTTYTACRDVAEEFWDSYRASPFQREGLVWASGQIAAFMAEHGYQYDPRASRAILEFTVSRNELKMPDKTETIALRTRDEWIQYENETDAEPDFADNEKGAAFAVVRSEKIVSCACTNDAFYADDAVEIHVETARQYRGRGFGYMCTAALAKSLCVQGYKVWYKCYEDNFASAALAGKCGMHFAGKRVSFVCFADV